MSTLAALALAVSLVAADAPHYDNEYEAARAALAHAMDVSEDLHREVGGMVLKCAAGYVWSTPAPGATETAVDYRVAVPKGCTPAALYHTHPDSLEAGATDARRFSQGDLDTAARMGMSSYIGVLRDRSILRYDPRTSRVTSWIQHSATCTARDDTIAPDDLARLLTMLRRRGMVDAAGHLTPAAAQELQL